MTYSPPLLKIRQEFERAVAAGATPLYSVQVGPLYALHRFAQESEKAKIDDYDRDEAAQSYAWPDKIPGGVVDLDDVTVPVENALLRYFVGYAVANLVSDGSNQVNSGLVFKTNAFADRSAPAFGSRDVQAGDVVRLRWNDPGDGSPQLFESAVAGFVADVTPGTTNPVNRWSTNFGDTVQGASESIEWPAPSKYTVVYDSSAYDGLPDGYPSDVYTIRVLEVGVGTDSGGTLDGTKLCITSAGNDTESEVILGSVDAPWNGAAYDITLGSRGATMTIDDSGSGSVYAGQYWQVTISMNYTEVDPTDNTEFDSIGPYDGSKNTQYIISVITGGEIGVDDVVFGFRTNNGADITGQLQVNAADFALVAQNDYPIGNRGMVLRFFKNTQWNTGDILVFDVTAETNAAYHTLVLQDTVPTVATVDLDMELFVRQEAELLSDYFEAAVDDITIEPYAFVEDDLLGVLKPFPIFDGALYADYRELRADLANTLIATDGITSIEDELGPIIQENPLAYAAYLARLNSGSTEIHVMPVESNDLAGYTEAFDALTRYDLEVWGITPLIDGLDDAESIKVLLKAHVLERSDESIKQWRTAWFSNPTQRVIGVYTETPAGSDLLGTIAEHGTSLYRKLQITGGLLLTEEVRGGDTLRINYTEEADGTITYDEYQIDRVVSETEAILVSGPSAAITVPIKIEIWRTLTKSEYAEALSAYPVIFGNRRIRCLYMDGPEDVDGNSMPLMYVMSALSGQRSGLPPHAPMSELELDGVYATPVQNFNDSQLNTIAEGGNWLVVKDFDGRIYTRHQVTTAIALDENADDLLQQEGSFTSNADDICRTLNPQLQGLVGEGNVSDDMLALIKQRFNSVNESIRNRPYSAKLGPQIQDVELTKLAVNEVHRDTVDLEADYDLPAPMNHLDVVLSFGVA